MPDKVGESLYLNSITSSEGLKLPDKIGGSIYLTSLESLDGLDLSSNLISKMVFSDKIKNQLKNQKTL